MTHEFRTPVNAIIGLCNLLIEEREQERREPEPELDFITKAAEQLSTLVNDLLDLAKVEAGKTEVRRRLRGRGAVRRAARHVAGRCC